LQRFRGACVLALTPREVIYSARPNAIPKAGGRPRLLDVTAPVHALTAFGETLFYSTDQGVYRSAPKPPLRVLAAHPAYQIVLTRDHLLARNGGDEPGLWRVRHDGEGARLLYGGDMNALAADDSHAFIACREGGELAIRRVALADGEMALLARWPGGSPELALSDTHVYFTDPVDGLLLRVAK
jgi:hypothetical protein